MTFEISTTGRDAGHKYYLILRARVSVSQHATRESGATVDIYDVRAAGLLPPVEPPDSNTQIIIPLGAIDRAAAEAACRHVADSGLMERAFQTRTDPGCTNAKIVDQDAVAAISALVDDETVAAVTVTLPQAERAELDRRAAAHGISGDRAPELVRRLLLDHVRTGYGLPSEPTGLTAVTDRDGVPWLRDGSSWRPAVDGVVRYEPVRGDGLRWQELVVQRGGLTPITTDEALAWRPDKDTVILDRPIVPGETDWRAVYEPGHDEHGVLAVCNDGEGDTICEMHVTGGVLGDPASLNQDLALLGYERVSAWWNASDPDVREWDCYVRPLQQQV